MEKKSLKKIIIEIKVIISRQFYIEISGTWLGGANTWIKKKTSLTFFLIKSECSRVSILSPFCRKWLAGSLPVQYLLLDTTALFMLHVILIKLMEFSTRPNKLQSIIHSSTPPFTHSMLPLYSCFLSQQTL